MSPESERHRRTEKNEWNKHKPNLNAGAELLHHYQKQWESLHRKTEANSQLSGEVAKLVTELSSSANRRSKVMNDFVALTSTLPQINEAIDLVAEDLKTLEKQITEAENLLTDLQDKKEKEALDRLELDQKYQLALYKEKRARQTEELKVKLALEHAEKVKVYEKQQQAILKERQKVFQAAFEEELDFYKKHGKIEKKLSEETPGTPKLEEIEVEPDEETKAALDKFLSDTK